MKGEMQLRRAEQEVPLAEAGRRELSNQIFGWLVFLGAFHRQMTFVSSGCTGRSELISYGI